METKDGLKEYALPPGVSRKEIELRKRWLNFTPADEALVLEVDSLLQENIDQLIEEMYEHFLSFPETRSFFPDEATLRRAKVAQREYFLRLTRGCYDDEYVADRLRVGSTHYRIGLDPKWYLAAYNRILAWLSDLLRQKYANDSQRHGQVMAALSRLIFFDMQLAIESYTTAKECAIRQQRDAIVELETEKRVTRSILEDAPVGIVRLDPEFICLEANGEFLAMLDLPDNSAVIGQSLFALAPHLSREPFENVCAGGQPFRSMAQPLYFHCRSKIAGYFDFAVWPIRDPSGITAGLLAIFVNASDRVHLQQQREDFVATLTHDLKTPILAANRAIKLLMEGDFGPVAESQSRILETIHQSNDSLYRLVQTLLDVYRYDSGAKQLCLVEHDLSDTVRQLVEELQPLAVSRHLSIKAVLPVSPQPVLCDVEEMRRVVQNLLDNSLKFTPQGGSICVSLTQNGDATRIEVKDTGKGIADEDKPKLFQRFWQAATSGRYYASTGLGLYLCRKIVELHGGNIGCDSTLGSGSTFYFTVGKTNFGDSEDMSGTAKSS